MKRNLIIGAYILSFLLLSFYILVLVTTRFSHTNKEYELYYIKKDLQDWPGYSGLEYKLGQSESFIKDSDNRIKRRGNSWNSFEEDGCWTYGEYASLFYTGLKKQDLEIQIQVQDIREGAYADIYANGTNLGRVDSIDTYKFDLPSVVFKDDILLIEFLVKNYGVIGDDSRSQGIKIKEIKIDAASLEK